MAVLVTGGAGYIGSHTVLELIKAGNEVIIVDNFYNSSPEVLERLKKISGQDIAFEKYDVCNPHMVDSLFKKYPQIESVIHFAGYKAVGESVEKPIEYYKNNISSTLTILQAMQKYGVRNFVFSSSATVYGEPSTMPCTEDMPTNTATNPYGWTKLMIEQMLKDACVADKSLNVAILRYFNPIGAHSSGLIGEDPSGIPNNLLPYITQVAVKKHPFVRVFGDDYDTQDGTGVRDYIHVVDLALGHVAALGKLRTNCGNVIYNLGTGQGYSVLDVIKAFEKASGEKIDYKILPRRAGDIAINYADTSKALKELNWKAKYTLDDMCKSSWNWQKNNPNGYKE